MTHFSRAKLCCHFQLQAYLEVLFYIYYKWMTPWKCTSALLVEWRRRWICFNNFRPLSGEAIQVVNIYIHHDDVIRGKHFRAIGTLWGESTDHRWIPHNNGQWHGTLMLSLVCAWTNDWNQVEMSMIWEAMTSMWRYCKDQNNIVI